MKIKWDTKPNGTKGHPTESGNGASPYIPMFSPIPPKHHSPLVAIMLPFYSPHLFEFSIVKFILHFFLSYLFDFFGYACLNL